MEKSLRARPGFNPWVEKVLEEGNCSPVQSSCLENPVDRGAWTATVHGVTESRTWLNDSHTHTHTHTERYHCFSVTGGVRLILLLFLPFPLLPPPSSLPLLPCVFKGHHPSPHSHKSLNPSCLCFRPEGLRGEHVSASPRLRGPTSRVSAVVDLWAQASAFPKRAPVGLVLLALGPVLRA